MECVWDISMYSSGHFVTLCQAKAIWGHEVKSGHNVGKYWVLCVMIHVIKSDFHNDCKNDPWHLLNDPNQSSFERSFDLGHLVEGWKVIWSKVIWKVENWENAEKLWNSVKYGFLTFNFFLILLFFLSERSISVFQKMNAFWIQSFVFVQNKLE